MKHDKSLQAWRGTKEEAWCFRVMPLDGGEKLLYASPYVYEMSVGDMIQDENMVDAWHARVQALAECHGGKWGSRLPEPLHWNVPMSRKLRENQLDMAFDDVQVQEEEVVEKSED